jgi:hypothetical protein
MRHSRICMCLLRLCLVAALLGAAPAAHAQGCSMCRDTTAGSAPQIRAGLRRAIPVLAIPAIGLFVAFFIVARRSEAWSRIDEERQGLPIQQSIDKQPK